MTGSSHPNHEKLRMNVSRLRASLRHGGADYRFFNFLEDFPVIDPPRGALRGGGICHNRGYGGLNPRSSDLIERS